MTSQNKKKGFSPDKSKISKEEKKQKSSMLTAILKTLCTVSLLPSLMPSCFLKKKKRESNKYLLVVYVPYMQPRANTLA